MIDDFEKNKKAVGIFNKLADVYQTKFMDVSMYSDTFDFFCNSIPKKQAKVLDLGCGPGNITKFLLEKRPDLKILGVDLAPNMIELAKENNPTAEFKVHDGRDVESLDSSFDGIVCGFLLPYLNKEETLKLLTDSVARLKENGILYLSTMEGVYDQSRWKKGSSGDEIFMHFHEHDYLVAHLKSLNCSILSVERYEYLQGDEPTVDLVIVVKKN